MEATVTIIIAIHYLIIILSFDDYLIDLPIKIIIWPNKPEHEWISSQQSR